ncbi:MAG: ribonuclease E/G [Caulobacteraceae bacterium]
MSERRLYLDVGAGETRGVVSLEGRPERLLIARDGDLAVQALGARAVARVGRIERAAGLAFLDLGEGPDAILNLTPQIGRLTEGAAIEVEIRAEARGDKGASARFIGAGEGPPRLLAAAPSVEERLRAFDRDGEVRGGAVARSMADGAQDEALRTIFSLPGGGSLAVEPTRALVAVDVDLGERPGAEARRAARAANFTALGVATRVLRLKGLGGLVGIDLIGRGHAGPALIAAARAAFGPDNPGVAFGPIGRFGTLEMTLPRRAGPAVDILTDESGEPTVLTRALAAIRALEREATADGGGRFEAVAAPEVAAAAAPALAILPARLGARLTLRGEEGQERGDFEVSRL